MFLESDTVSRTIYFHFHTFKVNYVNYFKRTSMFTLHSRHMFFYILLYIYNVILLKLDANMIKHLKLQVFYNLVLVFILINWIINPDAERWAWAGVHILMNNGYCKMKIAFYWKYNQSRLVNKTNICSFASKSINNKIM